MASRRVLVVGGSGFVGTRVLRSALSKGLSVASLSRNGAPASAAADASLAGVEWLKADALAGGAPLREAISGCDAVISCLGAFGSNDFMHRINGDANAALAEVAAAEGVNRFVFVSADEIRPVSRAMAAAGYEGYYNGKLTAEAAVTHHFGPNGLILRPGPIYGTRTVSASISIPIGAVGVPLTMLFETSPIRALAAALPMNLGDLFMPWVSVDDVADAAVAHVVDADTGSSGGGSGPAAAGTAQDEAVQQDWKAIREAAGKLRMFASPEVSLFWDGGCPLCSKEIGYYQSIDKQRRVDWVDLTQNPKRLEAAGLAHDDAIALIHAVDHTQGNSLLVGVPAFLAVWERLPYWNVLPPILRSMPALLPAVESGYRFWARHRLTLTGRARALGQGSACTTDGACELKKP
eukprot:CAMPEP_0115867862 /NCGR_PEP_ID=MMETSP0287-20121206/20985_1 /TAXON_ID=412157 /ORGANISM="Chrysochromulina rotalis, Strain UIO044" /LENGTH=406 /DNA_ID=CAMNT_0003322477 /DNA_START=41 /DNA_END=1261 /DNA_ORIENTATION=+